MDINFDTEKLKEIIADEVAEVTGLPFCCTGAFLLSELEDQSGDKVQVHLVVTKDEGSFIDVSADYEFPVTVEV